jgi:hypothetical protein
MIVAAVAGFALIWAAGISVTQILLRGSGRSRPKRTMADIRTVATAVEALATDLNAYLSSRSIDDLAKLLEPTYIKRLPRTDAWEYPLRYESDSETEYRIGSGGRSGEWEKPRLSDYTPRPTDTMDADIVFGNGSFIQYPEGVQVQ